MARTFGTYGPTHPRLGRMAERAGRAALTRVFAHHGLHRVDSQVAREHGDALRRQISSGRPALLLGLGVAGHNSGASLVRVDAGGRLELLVNDEEERHRGVKHCGDFPERSILAVRERLPELGARPEDIVAALTSWDYAALGAGLMRSLAEEFPYLMFASPNDELHPRHLPMAARAPKRLRELLGLPEPLPLVMVPHHDAHAYASYALSPFAADSDPVAVLVVDGQGEGTSTSLYLARDGQVSRLSSNPSPMDSLGYLYATISSTQGGWPPLSSEGRYMGAAAWGDGSRLTNPYYRRLRQILFFGPDGELRLNRSLAGWQRGGLDRPYRAPLTDLLGPPIAKGDMWNPDAVLDVDRIEHAEVTKDRLDKAAALQLVFEDGLFHLVDDALRRTGATRLVLSGGTALNCVANMRVLETFDREWLRRYHGVDGDLELWVPPFPGDAGAPPGAAFAFAMMHGARPGRPLRHAFLCGRGPSRVEVDSALAAAPDIEALALGSIEGDGRERVAGLLGDIVAADGVVGLFQGPAETGPRALGHRSILANPGRRETLATINATVKHRERIRPLAPMVTQAAAEQLFVLAPGAARSDHAVYDTMVLTARARPHARDVVPAVVHEDGTVRLQIVRPDVDPLAHAFLVALGRRTGIEAAVNTSLNVGAPIAQTIEQALETLRRARGMDGIVIVDTGGEATFVWHPSSRPAAAHERLEAWQVEQTAGSPAI